ncbi:right-handed parallel beta-helix repeat-containing protein [Rhodobacteraceae bacterium KMS-5]|uniref:Right-handed parallel beta-helix repeat-containing protein n=2 Tax=Tabrizicola oligotrophica TaxID=2710650 RepID=A0A6M0QTQ6_9RHOB|nr:right-handed parallel beta-helix repeat-containing protein [Tabrizicola oligotrophica]
MNKAITEGLVLMPPPFSAGLGLWSSEDGTPGDDSYAGQPNAAFVPADQDFEGCLEVQKTTALLKLRCFQQIPFQPGLYLRVTARVKAISGPLPTVRIAGWAASSSGSNVTGADQQGPDVALTAYGQMVEVSAIIGSGNRQGVDMVWGTAPAYGHLGLDLTGPTGGVVRIDDISIEDVTAVFHAAMFDWVDVRDFGAVGDGVTDDWNAFTAADAAANGKTLVVSPGSYFIGSHFTFDNPVKFEGSLVMPASQRLSCTRDYNLNTYAAAFGSELEGFRRALQVLFYFTDHNTLDLNGRRIDLTEPIDVAALAGLTTFGQRRVLSNGLLSAASGSGWDSVTVTAVGTYDTANPTRLSGVSNIAAIPVGARISGTGVGREVYVASKNTGAGTLELSQPLWGGNGTRSYTFKRFKYLLDFGGFAELVRFEINDIEFSCGYQASAVNLPYVGALFRLDRCTFMMPRNKAVTSFYSGCQGLVIDGCLFNGGGLTPPEDIIGFNVNANDSKIRNNRSAYCAHFGVFAGGSHIIIGNHMFPDANGSPSYMRAGLIFTTPNVRGFITGNYIDHHFIELSNEYDPDPDFGSSYTFGGLTITGNLFLYSETSPAFRFITVSPKGAGHSLNGLVVTNNVFRSSEGNIDRVERVDTTNGTLNTGSFRNVVFENNTFTGVAQATLSPLYVEHNQTTAAATWVVDAADYMPFDGRTRNVGALVLEGPLRNAANAVQWAQPYVETEQGAGNRLVNLQWPSAVKGKAMLTLRCDNPV